MTLQLNLLILMLGAVQGGLMSLWFFRNRKRDRSHIYFSAFIGVVGLQLLLKVFSKVWLTENAFPWYVISNQLPYLIGPLLFLYCETRKGNRAQLADLLHFIPFIVAFIVAFVFVYWLRLVSMNPWPRAGLQSIQLALYAFVCIRGQGMSLTRFITLIAVIEFIIVLTLATMQEFYPEFPDVRWLFVVLSAMIYWISYQFVNRSEVLFSVLPHSTRSEDNKYAHSGLQEEEAIQIEARLRAVMAEQKLFLNSALTLAELARQLKVSRHHLSQVINGRLNKTFVEYLNSNRVAEVRTRLDDPAFAHLTIASIAHDCGFNSLSTFNDVFRKHYHVTPSVYRERSAKGITAQKSVPGSRRDQ